MHDIWFAQRVPDGGGHVGRLNAVQEVEAAARSIFPPAAQVFLRLAAEGLVLQMAASSSVPNSLYAPPPAQTRCLDGLQLANTMTNILSLHLLPLPRRFTLHLLQKSETYSSPKNRGVESQITASRVF